MNDETKPDKRAFQMEQLRRDFENAPTARELAWREIQLGFSPAYVSVKYRLPLADMLKGESAWKERVRIAESQRQPKRFSSNENNAGVATTSDQKSV